MLPRTCFGSFAALGLRLAWPSPALLSALVREVRARLGLSLFGMDLIRDAATGDFHLIDINYLPGYYGVPGVFDEILSMCVQHVNSLRQHNK